MSFRKRNVVVSNTGSSLSQAQQPKQSIPGTRPSPLDGRLTISTGTRSLDSLLAGHVGLPLGNSILIEENGTTDFGGTLLKYYAAEGITQGHHVHVLGANEGWGRELPGLATGGEAKEKEDEKDKERMKIAWRYERLGEAGVRERHTTQTSSSSSGTTQIFCHDFDLSKRLVLPSPSNLFFIHTQRPPTFDFSPSPPSNPFTDFLTHLQSHLQNTSPTQIHRIIIPSLLSPAFYPSTASSPSVIIQFLHALRALLRLYPTSLTALLTLPLSLHSRTTGLTRFIELLSDGVITLSPFPSTAIIPPKAPVGSAAAKEEPPQGMCEIHRLPVFHERGGGNGGHSEGGDDFAFSLSRRKGMVIKPFSLPPVEGDQEAQEARGGGGKELESEVGKTVSKSDLEF